jgi:hypothetical protein
MCQNRQLRKHTSQASHMTTVIMPEAATRVWFRDQMLRMEVVVQYSLMA